jgi:hypothetical protein
MQDIYLLSNGELEPDADAAQLDRSTEWPAALDADGDYRSRIRWQTQVWTAVLLFLALWAVVLRLSAVLFSSHAMAAVVALWPAVNGVLIVNAVLVAWRRSRVSPAIVRREGGR